MINQHIIAIQSPDGEINIGDSRLDEKNPYITNKMNNISNNENNQNNQNNQNSIHILIDLDENELRQAYLLQTQAFYIKLLCIIEFTTSGIRILTLNYIDYSIIDFIFSGYGYYSVTKFNKSGIGIYSIYQLYKLVITIYYYYCIIYYYTNNILVADNYNSLILLSGFIK